MPFLSYLPQLVQTSGNRPSTIELFSTRTGIVSESFACLVQEIQCRKVKSEVLLRGSATGKSVQSVAVRSRPNYHGPVKILHLIGSLHDMCSKNLVEPAPSKAQ